MIERTILCFGDSNTHGTRAMRHLDDRRRFDKKARWPNVMATQLGAGWDIVSEGHPGRNAVFDDPIEGDHKNGLRALPVLLESHRPIDLVIVMLGTNDQKARFSVHADDIAAGLVRLVGAIKSSDAGPERAAPSILLAAPVPIKEAGCLAPMFEGGAAKSLALAPLLQDIAARYETGFIDLGRVARVDEVDGIHLSAEAQVAIGKAMALAVKGMLP